MYVNSLKRRSSNTQISSTAILIGHQVVAEMMQLALSAIFGQRCLNDSGTGEANCFTAHIMLTKKGQHGGKECHDKDKLHF